MVFSSVPPYLDHHNWHHQLSQSNHQGVGGGDGCSGVVENTNLPPPVLPPQLGGSGVSIGGGEGSIKPGSMIDRARLAKLPLPEPGLNCPRCDSTNTKFCYFNNYSLTQPRHFCKTCRRYWTRGGALRNVPVGGGCRRNKRSSKSRRSKSPSQSVPGSLSVSPPRSNSENMITSTQIPHPPSLQLPFMSSLTQFGGVGGNLSSNNVRFQPQSEMRNLQIGNGSNLNNTLSIGGGENWRLPLLPGFEVANNTNQLNYHNEGVGTQSSLLVSGDISLNNNSGIDHNPHIDPMVKAEDNRGNLDLSRQFLGMLENTNPQPWAGTSWPEFPSASTSTSTTHYL